MIVPVFSTNIYTMVNISCRLCLLLARLYESTGRAIAVTPALASALASALLKMLKFYEYISLEVVDGSS